jgi:hypothetical protein
MLQDSSYQIIQTVLAKLAKSFPGKTSSYISKVSTVRGPHERVRIAKLELEAIINESRKALAELSDMAGPGWEFITRQNAMGAFKRIGVLTEEAAANMLEALFSTNNRLSAVASSTLSGLCEITANKAKLRQVVEKQQLEKWMMAMVEPMIR